MKTKKFYIWITVIIILIISFFMMGPFYIINEGTQVVVTRFGQIVQTQTNAGLYFKIPYIDQVTTYPKLILSLDGDAQRIPTAENQFIIVDTTSRWRIDDPAQFYQSFKTLDAAFNRMSDIIDSATRTVITGNPLSEVVRSSNIINEQESKEFSLAGTNGNESDETAAQISSLINAATVSESVKKGRRELTLEMVQVAKKMMDEYGIELIDILPRQIKYSDELTESVYNRMIADRNQVAQAYRSFGQGKKADWLGKLEKDKKAIQSDAYRQSEEIKGKADAEAAAIYANAYNKDPEFYTFWKSMESYKQTLPKFNSTYSTGADYFKYMYSPEGNR